MNLRSLVLLGLLISQLGLSACQQSGNTSPALRPAPIGPGDGKNPPPPPTDKPGQPGPGDKPDPAKPPVPPPPDAKALWKSYRALYTVVSRNKQQVCADAKNCRAWADRLDPDYVDQQSGEIIPQLVSWKLILRFSGDSTSSSSMSIDVPVFADRGTAKVEDGKLLYDFSGPIRLRGSGNFDLKLHLALEKRADGMVLLHLDLEGAGQEFHDDFELKREEGTDLEDPPAGIIPGALAVYEFGSSSGYYQGVRCTISFNPSSRFPIWARLELIRGREAIPARGMMFKSDSVGLYKAAMALWSSHGSVKDSPDSRRMDYYSVFAPVNGTPTEIPVYGIGLKDVKTDASWNAVYEFKTAVKSLCDQSYGFEAGGAK